MLRRAWDYIQLNKMIEKGDRIVAGVSGGADSVCLLYVLKEFCTKVGAALAVVHVNHGIRGEEAVRDEQYVKVLCSRLEVDFYSYFFDVKKLAKEQGLSEEEAGRKVRYDAFLETCKILQFNKIATAHNKNDSAETILFNLFRGTGIKGLTGIEPKRIVNSGPGEVTIIRPLLCTERKEIEEFLASKDIAYQIDSTNLTEDYSRNKIRNRILKYAVDEINYGAVSNISEAAIQLREIDEYLNAEILKKYRQLVKQTGISCRISVKDMLAEPFVIQKGILYKLMENLSGRRKDLEAKHVDAILSLFDKQVGRCVHLPYRMIAEREYDGIKLYLENEQNIGNPDDLKLIPVKIEIPGKVIIPQLRKVIKTELIEYKKSITIPKSSCAKWFNYDKIENAVEIRTRREGDFIQVNASGGNKKLKDYFIDHKIPRILRDSQLLIADGSHIMWITGDLDRISEKYKVDESATKVLLMKMYDMEEEEDAR